MEENFCGWELSWFYNCKKNLNYYKVVKKVLQSGTAFCLQSGTTVFTKWDGLIYYKVGQFYYKVGRVLQSGTNLLQGRADITKCDNYYKVVLNKSYY